MKKKSYNTLKIQLWMIAVGLIILLFSKISTYGNYALDSDVKTYKDITVYEMQKNKIINDLVYWIKEDVYNGNITSESGEMYILSLNNLLNYKTIIPEKPMTASISKITIDQMVKLYLMLIVCGFLFMAYRYFALLDLIRETNNKIEILRSNLKDNNKLTNQTDAYLSNSRININIFNYLNIFKWKLKHFGLDPLLIHDLSKIHY